MRLLGKSKEKQSMSIQPCPSSAAFDNSQSSFELDPIAQSQSVPYQQQDSKWNLAGYQCPPQSWAVVPVWPPSHQPIMTQNQLQPPQQLRQSQSRTLLKMRSVTNLVVEEVPQYFENDMHHPPAGAYSQGVDVYESMCARLDEMVAMIDEGNYDGHTSCYEKGSSDDSPIPTNSTPQRSFNGDLDLLSSLTNGTSTSKASKYANSRLPPDLPPMKLYLPTYPLICLAARYSENVYNKPIGQEKDTHVSPDWRIGTKAMVIKSVPMDDKNVIVFAIRGSTPSVFDWTVNFQSAPVAPDGFLDDPGNLCHSGFLNVARKTLPAVASRLRHLLEEDPSRASYSLLITGHSAGGAVASLIYAHMLSTSPNAQSELTILTGCFKRIHCVTFGAPPVSLLPLQKPDRRELRNSVFLGFVNEGDLVARAERKYVFSILDMRFGAGQPCALKTKKSNRNLLASSKMRKSSKSGKSVDQPIWPVPEATLSNAGRLVLLRSVEERAGEGVGKQGKKSKKTKEQKMEDGVLAQWVTDDLLRGAIFSALDVHKMEVYRRRVEVLATNAVVGSL